MNTATDPPIAGESGRADDPGRPYAGVSDRQGKAIEALLTGVTIVRAADAAGVHERTLRKWLRRVKFRSVLAAARREAFGQAIGLTQKYAPLAVGTLVKVMQDPKAGASAKVTAAMVLLKFGREGIELDDLALRVEELEALVAGATPRQRQIAQAMVSNDEIQESP